MTTVKQVAEAFASGKKAKCHNAETDGQSYWLHGSCIAYKDSRWVTGNWCGFYTATTANHLNKIADAIGSKNHFSYSSAKLNSVRTFQLGYAL